MGSSDEVVVDLQPPTNRKRQTAPDVVTHCFKRERVRQTDRARETERDRERQRQKDRDRERQRETERDRERQR